MRDRAGPLPVEDLQMTVVVVVQLVVVQAVNPICILGVTSTPYPRFTPDMVKLKLAELAMLVGEM